MPGEPLHTRHALGVSLPRVNLSLGDEALVRRGVRLEVDADVLGNVEEGAALESKDKVSNQIE